MISKAQISFVKSLHQKKVRQELHLFLAEGQKVVSELVFAGFEVQTIFISERIQNEFIEAHTKVLKNTKIIPASETELLRMSTLSTSTEIISVVKMKEGDPKNQQNPDYYKDKLTICLDQVRDPGNLGTIIRIADWFGIQRIICSENSVEVYNPKTVQSTMGSIARVEVIECNLSEFFSKMKGIPVYGALLEGENIYKKKLSESGIILMGSESHGISDELKPFITSSLTIPSFGGSESLNVAVATGIMCFEFRRAKN